MSSFAAALRRARQIEEDPIGRLLSEIPADAEYEDEEDPKGVIFVWFDGKFIPYGKWLARRPLSVESVTAQPAPIPATATCVAGVCGTTRVWLTRDGDHWSIYAGSRQAAGRRRDFSTPFLGHAIRTAEFWYGAPATGWRAEGGDAE